MADQINSGIIIRGGSFSARDVAVGDHAKIEQSDWQRAVDQPLADLRDAIDGFSGQPATRDALVMAHAKVAEELASPVPDKQKLLDRLTSLSALAGPAATVVQAAAALAQVIAAVL